MSLQKKIILSFVMSATIIAVFAVLSYVNFVEVRKEIRYLELADTVRSKSLQLRRHEKNFFLYEDSKEIEEVHTYLRDLKTTLEQGRKSYNTEKLIGLGNKINKYSWRFNRIEVIYRDFLKEFAWLKPLRKEYSLFFPLIESTFLERPLVNVELLRKIFSLKPEHKAIRNLQELSTEITSLRKDGEEILTLSKDLDKSARERVEKSINISQNALLILFPLFLFVGIGALFAISHSVVKRLKLLTKAIEMTGKGDFSSLSVPAKGDEVSTFISVFIKMKQDLNTEQDEVGTLINAFVKMEHDIIERDNEVSKKNEELLQSRKLASIGTLASGVAHELNNPLNNIYLAAQVLSKEIGQVSCPPIVRETVKDIFSQTLRVKRIVSDLLEFAREKAPERKRVNIIEIIRDVIEQMKASGEIDGMKCDFISEDIIELSADMHLMEQLFINLFTNARDAMEANGLLKVEVHPLHNDVRIVVSDTGKGILPKDIPRIFDPFFTTKEKGTGLGLAIVYSIIRKHNGKIEVDSEPYKGTAFTIILPR